MKVHIFGSCSGTEPMEGRHHTGLAIETDGKLFWFDCGEGSTHTAYLMGLDLMSIRAVFISHPHVDHIAGLPHLPAVLNKIEGRYNLTPKYPVKPIFFPKEGLWEGFKGFFQSFYSERILDEFDPKLISDGVLFDEDGVKITAYHNRHLREDGTAGWHSYSFRIDAEGKRVVFSGDILEPSELTEAIGEGADLVLTETGHHSVSDVCNYINSVPVKRLHFIHHGRAILADPEGCLNEAKTVCHVPVDIASDRTTLTID